MCAASTSLRYEGMAIYFVALVGFLVFYGLEHLRAQLRDLEWWSVHLINNKATFHQ